MIHRPVEKVDLVKVEFDYMYGIDWVEAGSCDRSVVLEKCSLMAAAKCSSATESCYRCRQILHCPC